jgi:hypothetical protein
MFKQVSIFLENKKGRLKDVLKLLADNNIDIRALTIAETADYGVLRLIVDNEEKAVEVLKENSFRINLTNVLGVEIQDKSGSLYEFVDLLYQHNINVEYAHTCTTSNIGKSAFIVRVDEDKIDEAFEIIKTCSNIKIIG